MEVFWLIGFAGWRAIECYSPHVILSGALAKSLNDLFAGDVELPEVEIAYRERLAAARSLIEQRDANAVRWPDDVPRPVLDRDVLDGDQNKAAYDLIVLATAFAFFHEFRHVMLDRDQVRPIERQEEELQCDVWAREFMTAKLARFAGDCGHEYQTVLGKRSMGLALAALILHEIAPKNAASPHYFSIKTRLTTLLRNTQLPDEHSFWTFMACLLVGIFRREHHAQVIPPLPVRHLAEELLAQLPE